MATGLRDPGLGQWLRPPRHLLVLFLGTTLGFWAALGWLGWRSLQQDRTLETQAVEDRLTRGSTAIAGELQQTLAEIDAQLAEFSLLSESDLDESLSAYGLRLAPDALMVSFDRRRGIVSAFPKHRLLYYPTLPSADLPVVSSLASSRAYARLATDPLGAIELFASMVDADDPVARAEAVLGMARAQAAAGRIDAALEAYAMLQDPAVLVDGRPAELLARLGRAGLLEAGGRAAEHREEIRRLDEDLRAARWQLTRAAFLHYMGQVREGLAGDAAPVEVPVALAEGVHALWEQWQGAPFADRGAAGQASRVYNDQSLFVTWRATRERVLALVAGPLFLEEQVIGPLRSMLDRQGIRAVLEDADGRLVVAHGAAGEEEPRAMLTPAATNLPWTLSVFSADLDADLAQFTTRRRLVIAGLVFLGVFVVAGSYLSVRAMTREIEAARLKSDFVAAVSHEFRTPLTLLRQFSDLLAEGRVTTEQERQRYYAALQRGTRRLTRLVEDLLDFGRMEAGSRAFTLAPILIRDCVLALAAEFQEEVASRGYHIDVDWAVPADVVVDADSAAIGRALWNLLDNAVKYSPMHRTIWLAGAFDGQQVAITVRDRGMGVSIDEQRTIFRKFVRGSGTGAQQVKGTGLGLALVEQIVEAHGGAITLDSTEGEGSTFAITLPARIARHTPEEVEWRAS